MEHNEQHKRIIMFFCTVFILGLLTALFSYMWYRYYVEIQFFRKGNWLVICIYALLNYTFTRIYGGYRIGYHKRGEVIYSALLALIFVNIITYLQMSLIGSGFLRLMPVVGLTVIQTACIILWAVGTDILYVRLYPPYRILVIYGNKRAEHIIYKMISRAEKYDVCEAVSVDDGLDRVFQKIDEYSSVLISEVKSDERNKILKYCFEHSVRTYLTPKISDMLLRGAEPIHLFDTPLLICRNMGLTFEQRLVKRALDLLLSTLGLIVFSPVMALIAGLIKLGDGGPVLYKQKRLTQDGRTFDVYKFRSMVVNAEKNGVARLASQGDDRITSVGKWIRKIRLDELPQLVNIFRGDMSVVGPRPERPEIAQEYERDMPEFCFRLKVKAGLTGYAQVMGKYNTTPYDKLKLDLMYMENYSLLLDIKLIMMTIKILFLPGSTEGVADGTRTPMPHHIQRKSKKKKTDL